MINVSINNMIKPLKTGSTVFSALQVLGYLSDGNAVMLGVAINKTFIPKDQWASTKLENNDQVDVLNPICGG